MSAAKASRSAFKGTLVWGTFTLPVAVYKSDEPWGISGELFHEGCDAKINSPRKCQEHPELDFPDAYSAVQDHEGNYRRIDRGTRSFILGTDSEVIEIVSSHKLSDLQQILLTNRFVACGFYELIPQRDNKKRPNLVANNIWASLLARLETKKRFLVLKAPLSGMMRYGALFSNGQFMPLLNEEEIREPQGMEGEPQKELFKAVDQMLEALDGPFPVLSCKDRQDAFDEWRSVKVESKAISPKKQAVSTDKTLVSLFEALESVKAK